MKHYVCILYSEISDKFFIGETSNIENRLTKHNQHFYDCSFTKIAVDWELFYIIECRDIAVARKIEKHIKRMKSRTYIYNLKIHPEILQKLLLKYTI
ncbi:GIY-YIG nuclease family protein [Chryseobacterium sp. cx-311]|uniref:GIY-YIG nuclease family protein n=1 Tax=Marnyiella aurantia TaxID=2758037 RepID=UPI001AE32C7E|nr:GIY-YIG nuclease family protein [Marnyiella aurantia]MBP0612373.1 GIY-YIG nuclease family protein [Marnyiella aurantia]